MKIDDHIYEANHNFLVFAFYFNNIQLLAKRVSVILKNSVAIFDENYYTVAYSDTNGIEDDVWLGGCLRIRYSVILAPTAGESAH